MKANILTKKNMQYTKYFDNCLAVFQGGGCKAIAYIGAYKEARKRGVIFNEIAGTSAGSIIAALIAAGATPEYLEEFIKSNLNTISHICPKSDIKLSWLNRKINNAIIKYGPKLMETEFPNYVVEYLENYTIKEFIKKKGMYNIDVLYNLMDNSLKSLLKLDHSAQFKDLIIDLNVVASDTKDKQVMVWNKNNCKNITVAEAVCASCSIPIFFTPYRDRYVDGGLLSNLPNFVFSKKPKYTNRLCFCPVSTINGASDSYYKSLLATVTDGAAKMQQNIVPGSHMIKINTGSVQTTDFDSLTEALVDKLISNGEDAVRQFLNKEDRFNPFSKHESNEIKTEEELYTYISTLSYQQVEEVFVSNFSTKWCWKLFPTLLKWVENNAVITVYSSNKERTKYEQARIRLLKKLQCAAYQVDDIPAYVFFVKTNGQWKGIIFSCSDNGEFQQGIFYDHVIDGHAIKTAMQKFGDPPSEQKQSSYKGIKLIDDETIFGRLGTLEVYESAHFQMRHIDIKDIKFMNNQIRLSKYRQINKLFSLYKTNEFANFENTALVFDDNVDSLVCPIVVEEWDGEYVIIEGKTRAIYAYHHGIDCVKAVVVSNVKVPLPCDTQKPFKTVQQIIVTDSKKDAPSQYESLYRHIEECLHPSETYLL